MILARALPHALSDTVLEIFAADPMRIFFSGSVRVFVAFSITLLYKIGASCVTCVVVSSGVEESNVLEIPNSVDT